MFSFFKKQHRHVWRTVLIDTSQGYTVTDPYTSEVSEFEHILLYQVCDGCGGRQFAYDDAKENAREYAKTKHSGVALKRTKWVQGGIIVPSSTSKPYTFIDPSYAPLKGFEEWAKAFSNDPEMKKLIQDNQMVDDAFGQLEVAVKLCIRSGME